MSADAHKFSIVESGDVKDDADAAGPTKGASRQRRGALTFVVDGVSFEVAKPFLAMHSPHWAERLAKEPQLESVNLQGGVEGFAVFMDFLKGDVEVAVENVQSLLHWGRELGVDYVNSQCDLFLLSNPASSAFAEPVLLDLAARYDMPLLYNRASETCAQGMCHVTVPEAHDTAPLPDVFASESIRHDLIKTHIDMGIMRRDGEMRLRCRHADHKVLSDRDGLSDKLGRWTRNKDLSADKERRARLYWQSRGRFQKPPEPPPEHNWRAVQTVWPHHSFRGEDWLAVPRETQPTAPLRSVGVLAIRGASSRRL